MRVSWREGAGEKGAREKSAREKSAGKSEVEVSLKTRQRPAVSNSVWDLKWVREPQQDRSTRTRTKLMDATEQLLTEYGLAGVTIAKVTKQAGSSNGSFYHYFEDKSALLYAVVERRASEITETVRQGLDPVQWETVPLLDILEGFVRFSLKSGKRSPGLLEVQRLLAQEDANVARRLHQTHRETRAALLAIVEPKLYEVKHPEPKMALHLMLETLRALINRRLRGQSQSNPALLPRQNEEVFVQELRTMTAAYLQIEN